MITKNLLRPRYKVIADYPGTPFTVGDIVEYDGNIFGMNEPQKFIRKPIHFPHVFKPLEWWEKRELSDFPAYLKVIVNGCSIGKGKIFKPISYGIYPNEGRNLGNEGQPFALFFLLEDSLTHDKGEEIKIHLSNCVPSTEEEYLSNAYELQTVSK